MQKPVSQPNPVQSVDDDIELARRLPGVDVRAALRRLGGDRELLVQLLGDFQQSFADAPAELRDALGRSDRQSAERLAHSIKGVAANLSADELAQAAGDLEAALRRSLSEPVPALVARLSQVLRPLLANLEALTNGRQPVPTTPTARPLPESIGTSPASHTVLIVDDSVANQRILHAAMEPSYRVLFASRADEALRIALAEDPDIILLDVIMPDMNGYELCAKLKANPSTAAIPVIFITALCDEADEKRGLDVGGIDYIVKPISPPLVRARVRNHLELKRYRDLLEQLSLRDGLTGIANRRHFDDVFTREWRRAVRSQRTLSMIVMDVDFFKTFNDGYGHVAGDECLKRIAHALADGARRPADLIARTGGEEFACLLPETDTAGAASVAERLRQHVLDLRIPHAHSTAAPWVTISLGVATVIPAKEQLSLDFMKAADELLYEAKRTGRNRIASAAIDPTR